ncbi:MAG TPA: S-layer homology domain-containing protein [Candidatus Acidoferrum sp.]|nr:S-layer homology domain-containing protein [Candidatus Acidoferrum sp.]
MKKRLLSALLALSMALSLLPAVSLTAGAAADVWVYPDSEPMDPFSGGDGKPGTPYEIATAQELANLAYLINSGAAGYCEDGVYYALTADIELNDWADDGDGIPEEDEFSLDGGDAQPWTPIGSAAVPFAANFDGGGHAVAGVYTDPDDFSFQGLFGKSAGSIRNLCLTGSYIKGLNTAGGLVGYNEGAVVSCYFAGTVTGGNVGGIAGCNGEGGVIWGCVNRGRIAGDVNAVAGGVAGINSSALGSGAYIANCYNTGAVTALGGGYAGGIVGTNTAAASGTAATVQNCGNRGDISSENSAGGIAGFISAMGESVEARIENCYSMGGVEGTANAGGVAGESGSMGGTASIRNCYATGDVAGDGAVGGILGGAQGLPEWSVVGSSYWLFSAGQTVGGAAREDADKTGVDAEADVTGVYPFAEEQGLGEAEEDEYIGGDPGDYAYTPSLLDALNACSGDQYGEDTWFSSRAVNGGYPVLRGFGGGSGEEDAPYLILTEIQLAWLAHEVNGGTNYSGKYFKMLVGLELNDDASDYPDWDTDPPLHTWMPIGGAGRPFAGRFDGGGHTVGGIYIDSGDGFQGLFGLVDGGTVKNTGVINSYIRAQDRVGGVVGYGNNAIIENCFNAGVVIATGTDQARVGGVTGYIRDCTVSRCRNTGTVVGIDICSSAGGVIGYGETYNISGRMSTIEYCANTGAVSGKNRAGGVVGYSVTSQNAFGNSTTIRYCYNAGAVSGHGTVSIVGGVAGNVFAVTPATVQFCYNMGAVSGSGSESASVGGVVGHIFNNHGNNYSGAAATLRYCYNTGAVDGSGNVGGVVGGAEANNGTTIVQNCWSGGSLRGAGTAGGVAGYVGGGTDIQDCWYDKQLCPAGGLGGSDAAGQAEGRLTLQMTGSGLAGSMGDDGNWTFAQDLYPRLADNGGFDMDGTNAACLSATPAFLYDNSGEEPDDYETTASVTEDFMLGIENDVEWTSGHAAVDISGDAAAVTRQAVDADVVLTGEKNGVGREVLLTVAQLPAVATPDAAIDYLAETLTGLAAGETYKVGGVSFTADAYGAIPIQNGWFGTTLSIVKTGDGVATGDSAPQSLDVPARPQAPDAPELSGKTATSVTVAAVAGLEYSIDGGESWQEGGAFSELTAGTAYSVICRIPATTDSFASAASPALPVTTDGGGGGGGGSDYAYYAVTASAGTGGSISPSGRVSVREGLDKTFTVTANEGFVISDILVDGQSVGVPASYTFKNVRRAHTIEALFAKEISVWQNPFEDVAETDWFYAAVQTVARAGLMNGTTENLFSPNLSTTRGMIATVLWRHEGMPQAGNPSTFADVETGAYYANAVAWAAENGIVTGYDADTYGPNDNITREQLAAILYRCAGYKEIDRSAAADLSTFSDSAQLAGYAIPAMRWTVAKGIVAGTTDTQLSPRSEATRAQVAVMLARFMELTK